MRWLALLLVAAFFASLSNGPARSHALQPGYLEISHFGGDAYRVFWRVPDVQGAPMTISARLPEHCDAPNAPQLQRDAEAWVVAWVTNCVGGLAGGRIDIEGLEAQNTDVLVRYESPNGTVLSERLTPDRTSFTTKDEPRGLDVVRSYLPLGFEHILEGLDHLLFVFALLLLIPDRWRLLGAITSFTVAHSITMAAATLGWVTLPGPPVEAVIALSIMFVASELAQRKPGVQRLSERYPWTVCFSFGLLHGFGFAGALQDIGLPEASVPLALLSFNIGVELGQLFFVGAILMIWAVIRLLSPSALTLLSAGSRFAITGAYFIGVVSTVWFIERVSAF